MAHDDDGNVLAVAVALAVVCVIVVGFRFHVRRSRQHGLKIDDWLCVPALIFTIICCSLIAAGSTYSSAVEQVVTQADVVRYDNVVTLQKLSFVFIALQPLALGFTKLSILFFYRRIFCGKGFDVANWTLVTLVGVWMPALFLASILQCGGSVSDFWTTTYAEGRCDALPISGAFITTDVLLDLMVIALPIPLVLRLQMPLKQRALACVIFLIGGASIPVALARLAFFVKADQDTPALFSQVWGVIMINSTGFNGIALFCPTIELGVALVAACEPALNMAYSTDNPQGDTNSPEAAWRSMVEKHKQGHGDVPLTSMQSMHTRPPPAYGTMREDSKDEEKVRYSFREML